MLINLKPIGDSTFGCFFHTFFQQIIHFLNLRGFKPLIRMATNHIRRTVEEVEAELMGLVGRELGELLLEKKNKAVVN